MDLAMCMYVAIRRKFSTISYPPRMKCSLHISDPPSNTSHSFESHAWFCLQFAVVIVHSSCGQLSFLHIFYI